MRSQRFKCVTKNGLSEYSPSSQLHTAKFDFVVTTNCTFFVIELCIQLKPPSPVYALVPTTLRTIPPFLLTFPPSSIGHSPHLSHPIIVSRCEMHRAQWPLLILAPLSDPIQWSRLKYLAKCTCHMAVGSCSFLKTSQHQVLLFNKCSYSLNRTNCSYRSG
jgi:hypothetical protein